MVKGLKIPEYKEYLLGIYPNKIHTYLFLKNRTDRRQKIIHKDEERTLSQQFLRLVLKRPVDSRSIFLGNITFHALSLAQASSRM